MVTKVETCEIGFKFKFKFLIFCTTLSLRRYLFFRIFRTLFTWFSPDIFISSHSPRVSGVNNPCPPPHAGLFAVGTSLYASLGPS